MDAAALWRRSSALRGLVVAVVIADIQGYQAGGPFGAVFFLPP